MQDPAEQALFLQNRLAVAAVLLHRCTKALALSPTPSAQYLVIECEDFFSETRSLLLAALAPEPEAGNAFAKPAETSGAQFQGWKSPAGLSSTSPAAGMERATPAGGAFSAPLNGGTPPTAPAWKHSLTLRMKACFDTKR